MSTTDLDIFAEYPECVQSHLVTTCSIHTIKFCCVRLRMSVPVIFGDWKSRLSRPLHGRVRTVRRCFRSFVYLDHMCVFERSANFG